MPDIAIRPTDLILGSGLVTAETIAQELRERLTSQLGKRWRYLAAQETLEAARSILREYEPILAENLLATDLAAWLAGFDELAGELPSWLLPDFRSGFQPPLPPRFTLPGLLGDDQPELRFPLIEKASESLFERNVLTREQFDLVSDAAKQQAFTVAGQDSIATLEDIRDVLAETVSEGASLAGFKERLSERIDVSAIGPAHLETVYRTNVQAAYRDGRESLASHPIVDELFPYQEYFAIHDSRVRDEHLALETLGLDNTGIYRRDDPFWDRWTPPVHYNCRCAVSPLTVDAAARRGVVEAALWLETGIKPAMISRLPAIPFASHPGWGSRHGVLVT